jgi:hypothetical protein
MPSPLRVVLLVVTMMLAMLVAAPSARAGDRVLVLSVVESVEDHERAGAVVSSQLGAAVTVRMEPAAADVSLAERLAWARMLQVEHDAVGVVWIDAGLEGELLLYLIDGSGEQALVRTIPAAADSSAAQHEALSVIVRSIVEALLAGETIGMHAVEEHASVEPVEPVAEPETPAPIRWPRLSIGLQVEGASFSDELPWLTAVGVELGVRPLPRLTLGIGYGFWFPATVVAPDIEFALQRNATSAFVGLHADAGRRLAVDLRAVGVLDIIRQRVVNVESDLTTDGGAARVVFGIAAQTRLWVSLYRRLGLFFGVGLEVLTNPFSYVIDHGGRNELLTLHRVRGTGVIGLGYGFVDRPARRRR